MVTDQISVGTFANRSDALPLFNISGSEDGSIGPSSDEEPHGARLKASSEGIDKRAADETSKSHKLGRSLQDRLFTMSVRLCPS